MNKQITERIKELAQQSGFYFYDLHDIDGQDLGETIEADSWNAAEKFADSIIEECAKRSEAYAYMSPNFTALAQELRRMKESQE